VAWIRTDGPEGKNIVRYENAEVFES